MYVMKHGFFFHNGCKQGRPTLNITTIQILTHYFCFPHHRALPLITQKNEKEMQYTLWNGIHGHFRRRTEKTPVYFTVLERQKESVVEVTYSYRAYNHGPTGQENNEKHSPLPQPPRCPSARHLTQRQSAAAVWRFNVCRWCFVEYRLNARLRCG